MLSECRLVGIETCHGFGLSTTGEMTGLLLVSDCIKSSHSHANELFLIVEKAPVSLTCMGICEERTCAFPSLWATLVCEGGRSRDTTQHTRVRKHARKHTHHTGCRKRTPSPSGQTGSLESSQFPIASPGRGASAPPTKTHPRVAVPASPLRPQPRRLPAVRTG